jgi:hypothetical protein
MTTRTVFRLCLLGVTAALPLPVTAQDISLRLAQRRAEATLRQIAAELPSPATGATQSGTPGTASASPRPRERHEITASIDGRLGFDKQSVVLGTPAVGGTVRRRIRTLDLSLEYPLSDRSSVFLTVPYVDQRATLSSPLGGASRRGHGLGDIGMYFQHRFPEIARGTELDVTVGMVLPTGKDSFEVAPDELPTGVGFYQPVARVMLSKMRVPMQFYGALDYGTAFSRHLGGVSVDLPDSYGGEVGFYYSLGPEFTSQTSVSVSKITSPFIDVPGSTVGYLSQSLTYQATRSTSLRGSIDVGLTDDSTDAFVGFSLNSTF